MTKEIEGRIDEIHSICKRLETAVQGDMNMGVKGIRHQMEELTSRIGVHEINDLHQFGDIKKELDHVKDNQKQNKWFLAGVVAVLSVLYALVQIILS